MSDDRHALPLVYACSGCSSAAQLCNSLALRLDRAGRAEMSCIAGIGGDVPSLVRKAREAAAEGRPIVALDGCVLACTRSCLAQRGLQPTLHVELWRQGVRKQYHTDFDPAQADALYATLEARLANLATAPAP
ncbi:putative zinc-binding protein [Eleftheria terrae]|uniref:putative zinc-binding protein n=1 Tax=Eleftheria terrae TaxID=1597781 RepID=UPI00263AB416|nr:putative zinc-binding protein [Eleftheria terrae]WKB54805.1 putative zinc-binding protein [Eleftheria terrae]